MRAWLVTTLLLPQLPGAILVPKALHYRAYLTDNGQPLDGALFAQAVVTVLDTNSTPTWTATYGPKAPNPGQVRDGFLDLELTQSNGVYIGDALEMVAGSAAPPRIQVVIGLTEADGGVTDLTLVHSIDAAPFAAYADQSNTAIAAGTANGLVNGASSLTTGTLAPALIADGSLAGAKLQSPLVLAGDETVGGVCSAAGGFTVRPGGGASVATIDSAGNAAFKTATVIGGALAVNNAANTANLAMIDGAGNASFVGQMASKQVITLGGGVYVDNANATVNYATIDPAGNASFAGNVSWGGSLVGGSVPWSRVTGWGNGGSYYWVVSAPGATPGVVQAFCNGADQVLGGGCQAVTGSAAQLQNSVPILSSPMGWHCFWPVQPTPGTSIAAALCTTPR